MFQVLDKKKYCVGIYKDGEITYDSPPIDGDCTWEYAEFLKGVKVNYASIYAQGRTLDECCPPHLQYSWKSINERLRAYISSFIEAKVSLKDNCFFHLVPQRFLKEYCELKNRICEHVFQAYPRPTEYDFYRHFSELISDIANQDLQINVNKLSTYLYTPQGKRLYDKVRSGSANRIQYNMFNSVTGRLTVTENSFPILNLSAKLRDVLTPTNNWFVSFDLNAAEMRIALALAGVEQPEGDLHEHVRKSVFREAVTRTAAKTISTQWLYDSKNEETQKYNFELSGFYNKNKLLTDYWQEGKIHTPYGRIIESDLHHAISYLCQSTLIDMFHRQILKVYEFLKDYKSNIACTIHDCLLIDLEDSEKKLLPEIIKILSDTPYGNFPVKVEVGNNFGNMKKINVKV